jgi:hypothetical protein
MKAHFVYLDGRNEVHELSEEEDKFEILVDGQGRDGTRIFRRSHKLIVMNGGDWFVECEFINVDFSNGKH